MGDYGRNHTLGGGGGGGDRPPRACRVCIYGETLLFHVGGGVWSHGVGWWWVPTLSACRCRRCRRWVVVLAMGGPGAGQGWGSFLVGRLQLVTGVVLSWVWDPLGVLVFRGL
jgi:hypothetical protein